MPKDEWGVKRACPKCATRFYDLQRDPMICPACGHEFTLESLTAPTGRAARVEKAAPEPARPLADAEGEQDNVDVLDDSDDDNEVDLGDDVLDEDEDETVDLDNLTDVPGEEEES